MVYVLWPRDITPLELRNPDCIPRFKVIRLQPIPPWLISVPLSPTFRCWGKRARALMFLWASRTTLPARAMACVQVRQMLLRRWIPEKTRS